MHIIRTRLHGQAGQAIVLIGLALVALIGFLGLAVDGGRVFIDRREQQEAADSAALAAADKYLISLNMPSAFQAGANQYAANARITSSPSVSPAWCASPPSPPTVITTCSATVTWPGDSHVLTLGFTDNRSIGKGIQFDASSTHSLPLAFMQVLGVATPVADAAQASTVIYDQSQQPAILTLGRAPCDGTSGNSLTVQGGAGLTVQVVGAVFSDGGIGIGGSATMEVAGNAYDNCGGTPISGISNSGFGQYSPVAPIQNNYLGGSSLPWAPNYTTSRTWPGSNGNVEVLPGSYAADPQITGNGVCYFMAAGMYTFNAGFTDNAGLTSNELRPPDEPSYSSNTTRAGAGGSNDVQFWRNGVTCDGAFAVHAADASASHPLPNGNWGIEITAGRMDTFYPSGSTPVGYVRESAPSMCRTVNPNGSNQGFQIAVSNVPGAQWYNIYANPGGCNGSFSGFGYVDSFCSGQAPAGGTAGCSQSITMSNQRTSGCPNLPSWGGTTPLTPGATQNNSSCSLGYAVSGVYDTSNIPIPFSTLPTSPRQSGCAVSPTPAAPVSQGCPAPDPELCPTGVSGTAITCISTTANAPAARNKPYVGDTGNENQCMTYGSSPASCPGEVTPGAIQMDFTNASNSCLSAGGGGGIWVFSGQQYGWIVAYSTNSTCGGAAPNKINGNTATSFIGTLYFPQTSITLSGNGNNAIASQLIALTATLDGSSGVTIAFNPNYALPPPAGRLVK